MSQSLTCKKCGHVWSPRKSATRCPRQCPRCGSTKLDSSSNISQTQTAPTASTPNKSLINRTNLPKAIYDLVGILDAASPENAVVRAFELCRKLSAYKYKYNLESLEAVFEFLEKEALEGNRQALEAKERLEGMFDNPERIFLETVGADLAAVRWYDALRETGYDKDFLDFLSEAVNGYWESQGYELRFREKTVV